METSRKLHPKTRANIISSLFFVYAWESFRKGGKHLWNQTNIYEIQDEYRSNVLGEKIERLWFQHDSDCKKHRKNRNLLRIIFRIFWLDMIRDGFLLVLSNVPRLFQPILLKNFLRYFSANSSVTKNEASIHIISLVLVNFIGVLFTAQFKLYSHTTSMKIKLSCMSLIHRKVMRMKVSIFHEGKCGNALTLISNDLNQFDQSPYHIHFIWASPLFISSTFFILIFDAGIPGLVGVIWFIFYMFLQSYIARVTGSFRNKIAKNTDKRVKLMSEILNGIEIIKMFVWEKVFINLVSNVRKHELKEINKVNYLKSLYYTISHFVNSMAVFIGMLTMVLLNEQITVPKVFNLVAYYNSFNFFIAIMFPLSITKLTEMQQVFQRIDIFLNNDEVDEISQNAGNESIILQNVNSNFCLTNTETKSCSEFSPLLVKDEYVLKNISLNISNNEFIGIIGPVGSGKTCMIQTILGETFVSGFISVNGSISYASQDPWIFHGTIRQNILFGEMFNEKRYREVLRICCLNQDLKNFPDGDMVVVGERGTTLSGGQKSRINLARAVYKNADIYLLDNPLASLDVNVANQILKNCINGFLTKKCRILVTHCIQHLEKCNRLIVFNSGRIEYEGNYEPNNMFCDFNFDVNDHEKVLNSDRSKDFKKIVEPEKKLKIPRSIFSSYLSSGNSFWFISSVFLAFVFNQFMNTSIYYYVSYWANIEENRSFPTNFNRTTVNYSKYNSGTLVYINIFILLLGIYVISSVVQAVLYSIMVMRNSKKIHENLLNKLMNSKMNFFNRTESGNVITRFSKDLGFVDDQLVRNLIQSFVVILALAVRILIVTYLNPYMIITVIFTILFLCYSTKLFVNTTQNLKRLESSLVEPVLTHLNATIQGLITIRAAKAQNMMKEEYNTYQDHYASSYYMYITVSYAFCFAIEFMSFIFITIVTTSCFFMRDIIHLNGGEVGLMISQAVLLATALQFGVIQLVLLKNNLVSVERIFSYNKLHPEIEIVEETLSKNWPETGDIKFENVKVYYLKEDIQTPVLNISFEIYDREKIGIIGRTGAGKSSIFSSILGLVSFEGMIRIDSYDTSEIPLKILRSQIGVIPQDPTLFSGTLRFNLDPLDEYNDNILYETLNQIEFFKAFDKFKNLNDEIKENGANLSVGQRQLICLARVLMRKNKIVLLDEATSNMDERTDELIRNVIRKQFSENTVLTIAHKLSNVMDFDRVMVIDSGKIIQFDRPEILMKDHKGEFYKTMLSMNGKMKI